jgi:hypothetical protein
MRYLRGCEFFHLPLQPTPSIPLSLRAISLQPTPSTQNMRSESSLSPFTPRDFTQMARAILLFLPSLRAISPLNRHRLVSLKFFFL